MPYAKGQKWKCGVCKGEILVDSDGDGDLVCCGENMELETKEEVEAPRVEEAKEEEKPSEPPPPPS